MGFFEKIKNGLKKTRDNISNKINLIINSFTKIDEEFFAELEETMIASDIGVETAEEFCEKLRDEVKKRGLKDPSEITQTLKDIMIEMLECDNSLDISKPPAVILVLGVNGVGKTTTIGKLADRLKSQGKTVLLAAADTFRAAAAEQLDIWAKRASCPIVKQPEGSDPAAVVFDAISSAKSKNIDIVICDTAGRLHNKKNLMGELEKINRIISRELPDSSKETLLVLDASTGQNGLNQAVEFGKSLNINGIVLTKLDGTARGGIILCIKKKLGVPVKFIGVGEGIEDLRPFDAKEFVEAIFESEESKN